MSCSFHSKKVLPYSPSHLYRIVSDIESYPLFLPGCQKAEILEHHPHFARAKLTIGYGPFQESYISKILLTPSTRIEVVYESGPFQYLKNYWEFKEIENNQTEVIFFIDFKFRSFILQKAIESAFYKGVHSLMNAFETRARFLSRKT